MVSQRDFEAKEVKVMAITKTVTKQTLTLNVEDGVNSQGAAKTKGHN